MNNPTTAIPTITKAPLPKAAAHCEVCAEEWHSVYPHSTAPDTWHIPASRGAYYAVTKAPDGTWRCSCAAASFGNACCRHITSVGGVLDMEVRLELGMLPELHIKYLR